MATVTAADKAGTSNPNSNGNVWGMEHEEEQLSIVQRVLSYLWIGFTQPSPPAQRKPGSR